MAEEHFEEEDLTGSDVGPENDDHEPEFDQILEDDDVHSVSSDEDFNEVADLGEDAILGDEESEESDNEDLHQDQDEDSEDDDDIAEPPSVPPVPLDKHEYWPENCVLTCKERYDEVYKEYLDHRTRLLDADQIRLNLLAERRNLRMENRQLKAQVAKLEEEISRRKRKEGLRSDIVSCTHEEFVPNLIIDL